MSVNKCIFIGNMGRDAEVRTTETGIKVAQFSIACTERAYTNKAGQTIPERTEWIPVVAWRDWRKPLRSTPTKGANCILKADSQPGSMKQMTARKEPFLKS
ncbi:single-stranded DNA-binding protein [Bacteroides fragilis]|nr:single-stranded DNA-binding protein [Bacteroides fragilis]